MDEDQESSTPPWPGRETIWYGLQGQAEPQGSNGLNGPASSVPVTDKDSGGTAIIEVRSEPTAIPERSGPSSSTSSSRDNGSRASGNDEDGGDGDASSAAQHTAPRGSADAGAEAPPARPDESELIARPLEHADNFSEPAGRCIAKAGWIAYVLNHTSINTGHLSLP